MTEEDLSKQTFRSPSSAVNCCSIQLLIYLILVDKLKVDGLAGHKGEGVVKTDLVVAQLLNNK